MTRPTLLLFPGLGVDARVYEPQRVLPVNLEVAEWIEPESLDEPLSHYADRMAEQIGPRPDVYIGGISLGAMVAMEAATRLQARGVVVIGGCTSHHQVSPLFRTILRAGAMLPLSAIRLSLRLAPLALKLFEKLDPAPRRLMTQMLREHSTRQIRWNCRAILKWECCGARPTMPVYWIHGELDEVIPHEGVRAQHVVPGGRHLISLTHAEEVNRFILKSVYQCIAPE
jgi:pimeloyl-ACP methyl ester carboxylesterase